ncbi:MAG: glycine/betaine ABC transporter substrate-binding protein [Actinomycetota bacterium]|nr:glycine/betaine ABC transporter substrate-binding protein [Actinomycetota bacterium]
MASAALGTLAACGSESTGADGGPATITDTVDLSGAQITVGSKDFTEQLLLGQLTIQVLQAAGATVEDRTGLASTGAAREALEAGATDVYWEYTGTGWLVILEHSQPVADPARQFDAVAEEDLRQNDIRWLGPPAPANNTYALAIRDDVYDEQSADYDEDLAAVTTLSDLGQLVEQSPEKATLCVAPEFARRDDGLPGLEKAYDLEVPGEGITTVEQEVLIYPAVDSGRACNFGEVFRTDGQSQELGLRLLEDDKDFFAVYNPALTLRADLLEEYPDLAELFTPIAEALDDTALQEMSAAVDVDGRPVRDVAQDFLEENEFLTPQQLTK